MVFVPYHNCKENVSCINPKATKLLSSALKPGAHFFENNKITGVFTMLKLCVSKERLAY